VYLGIDLGTGSVKTMLLDDTGTELTASRSYHVEAPAAGYAESAPESWLAAIAEALSELGDLGDLRGVGFSGQMHGVVPVRIDGKGLTEAIHPAILWADRRATEEVAKYRDLPQDILRRLGNSPAPGMAGTSLAWLRRHRPEILDRADAVLLPKDYVRAVLTGRFGTDHSDASGTLLYNFETRTWDTAVLEALDIPQAVLPPISYSVESAGTITRIGADRFGIPEGVPVAVGAGDTPAAMYGTGLTDPSVAQVSVGTAAQVGRPVDPGSPLTEPSSLSVFEGAEASLRYRVAAMLNGGIALEWVRSRLGFQWRELYERLERRGVTDPDDLIFLPYLTGERTPHMNPEARGAWVGLSLHHTSDDLAYAALVGVACTVRLGIETLEKQSFPATTIRLVGGSARFRPWRHILSAIIRRPLAYSEQPDSSARGAAWMAAASIGKSVPAGPVFETEQAVVAQWVDAYYQRFLELYQRLNS